MVGTGPPAEGNGTVAETNNRAGFELVPQNAERDMLDDFVTEARESLEECEAALLVLEAHPEDGEAVNTVFRCFHTIKGTASCLGLADVGHFAHGAESLLSRIRDGEIRCEGVYAELALRAVDALKSMVEGIHAILGGEAAEPPPGVAKLILDLGTDAAEPAARMPPVRQAPAPEAPPPPASQARKEAAHDSIRVRTDRLDRLIEMVGELVVAESMVTLHGEAVAATHPELNKQIDRTGKIIRELQDLSLSMRMVPVRGMFQKLTRIVRDLSRKCDKPVEFVTDGEDTEIDRTMVELISDPLVHMVRNAVDHGLEPPADRAATNKPAAGLVRLSATHAGGNIVIVLQDDGRGLDRDKILDQAIRQDLVRTGAGLSDCEVFNLILEAGFSTAAAVTDISGRGVGLDVVRRSIDRLQGRLEIQSTPGASTTFTIRLPLTLAITDGMQIRVGEQRYILPTVNIAMSLKPRPDEIATVVGRGELLRRRNDCFPLYRLGHLFDVPGAAESAAEGLVIVVDDGERQYGLLVDELVCQQQVVVKPLESGCGKIKGVSGAVILGDGSVGLILEPREIGLLGAQFEGRTMQPPANAVGSPTAAPQGEVTT